MRQHAAFADDVGVVANAQGLAHVVVGDQHADVAVFQEGDDALDLNDGNRVDAGKGLVEQDKARLRGQGAGDFHSASLATRERQRRRLAQMFDPQVLQQGREAGFDIGAGQRPAVGADLQLKHCAHVVFNVELAKNRRFLRQVAQPQARAAVDGHVFNVLAVYGDLAAAGAQQANNHVKGRGFARAVGSEQAHHLAGAHRQ